MSKRSNSKASVFYAIVSNTIVLVLIGLFLLLFFHTNAITSILKERINIIVELNDDASKKAINQLGQQINSTKGVKKGSVDFIPAEEALTIMGNELDLEFDQLESPFRNVIVFNVEAEFYHEEFLDSIKTNLDRDPIVLDVIYKNLIIDNIKSNLRKLSLGLLILNVFFLILVIVIMYNTINLSLYADRWEIKTMEIIGARDRFIRQPYLKIAGRIALTSFIVSALILLMVIGILYFNSTFISNVLIFWYLLLTLIIIFILSFCITIIATIRIVNNYLYKEESDLY